MSLEIFLVLDSKNNLENPTKYDTTFTGAQKRAFDVGDNPKFGKKRVNVVQQGADNNYQQIV